MIKIVIKNQVSVHQHGDNEMIKKRKSEKQQGTRNVDKVQDETKYSRKKK